MCAGPTRRAGPGCRDPVTHLLGGRPVQLPAPSAVPCQSRGPGSPPGVSRALGNQAADFPAGLPLPTLLSPRRRARALALATVDPGCAWKPRKAMFPLWKAFLGSGEEFRCGQRGFHVGDDRQRRAPDSRPSRLEPGERPHLSQAALVQEASVLNGPRGPLGVQEEAGQPLGGQLFLTGLSPFFTGEDSRALEAGSRGAPGLLWWGSGASLQGRQGLRVSRTVPSCLLGPAPLGASRPLQVMSLTSGGEAKAWSLRRAAA